MLTISSREIFTKKCRQQQNFDSDPKEAWHYNHVTFTPIAENFMLHCRLIYMLSMLYVGLTIKINVGLPESFKVGWYPRIITGSSHLNLIASRLISSATKQCVANRDPTKTAFLINSVAVFLQTVIILLTTIP